MMDNQKIKCKYNKMIFHATRDRKKCGDNRNSKNIVNILYFACLYKKQY